MSTHDEGQPAPSHIIARAQGIPELFLLKVLKQLALAGLLRSLRGPSGGYRLACKPKDISLLEVVEAVDGPLRGQVSFDGPDSRQLEAKLQKICDDAADQVRRRFQKVRISELVGHRETKT
jgi:Rrf2 family protein